VTVKDGGAGPYTAMITEIEPNGTIVLAVDMVRCRFVSAVSRAGSLR
jgi:hypothetical protein